MSHNIKLCSHWWPTCCWQGFGSLVETCNGMSLILFLGTILCFNVPLKWMEAPWVWIEDQGNEEGKALVKMSASWSELKPKLIWILCISEELGHCGLLLCRPDNGILAKKDYKPRGWDPIKWITCPICISKCKKNQWDTSITKTMVLSSLKETKKFVSKLGDEN